MSDDFTPRPTPTPPKKKRTPVPKVEKVDTAPAIDAFTEEISEPTPAVPENEATATAEANDNPKDNIVNRIKALVINNQETLKRKLIVGIGTGLGMIIASSVIDAIGQRKPDVVYLELDKETLEPTDVVTPAE